MTSGASNPGRRGFPMTGTIGVTFGVPHAGQVGRTLTEAPHADRKGRELTGATGLTSGVPRPGGRSRVLKPGVVR